MGEVLADIGLHIKRLVLVGTVATLENTMKRSAWLIVERLLRDGKENMANLFPNLVLKSIVELQTQDLVRLKESFQALY